MILISTSAGKLLKGTQKQKAIELHLRELALFIADTLFAPTRQKSLAVEGGDKLKYPVKLSRKN